ncbi:MAG TPA: oligosaccharide flippase family protein [Chloroflexia bacterium]|nr:oligosaccharide flippase family protein [Chloroflexia bacterium]
MRALLASLGRGAGWKLMSDLLGRVLQYALLMLAARSLDLAGFGDFTFALSVGLMLSQVADFGLQLYLQRELARLAIPEATQRPYFIDERATARLVGGGLVIKVGLSAVSFAVMLLVVLWEPVGNKGPVLLIGLSMIGLTALEYLAYCFRALRRLKNEAIAYVTGRAINLLLGAALLYAGLDVWALAVAANVAAVVAIVYSYSRLLAYVRPDYTLDLAYWRRSLGQPVAMGLGIVFSMFAFRVDNLLIPPIVGAAQASETLSIYNAAYRLFEMTLIVPGVVLAATFSLLSRAGGSGGSGSGGGVGGLRPVLGQTMMVLLGLGVLASIALWVGAVPLTGLLYGDKFGAAVPVLQVLALGCIPMYASYGLTHALVAVDRPQLYAAFTGVALVVNVAANLLLIPRVGVQGAAFATFLTEVALVVLCAAAVLRHMRGSSMAMPAQVVQSETGVGGTL